MLVTPQYELGEHIQIFEVFKPKQPSKGIVEALGQYSRVVYWFRPPTTTSQQASNFRSA